MKEINITKANLFSNSNLNNKEIKQNLLVNFNTNENFNINYNNQIEKFDPILFFLLIVIVFLIFIYFSSFAIFDMIRYLKNLFHNFINTDYNKNNSKKETLIKSKIKKNPISLFKTHEYFDLKVLLNYSRIRNIIFYDKESYMRLLNLTNDENCFNIPKDEELLFHFKNLLSYLPTDRNLYKYSSEFSENISKNKFENKETENLVRKLAFDLEEAISEIQRLINNYSKIEFSLYIFLALKFILFCLFCYLSLKLLIFFKLVKISIFSLLVFNLIIFLGGLVICYFR